MKIDPATMREAARQLREEARLYGARDKDSDVDQATDSAVAGVLESMARRFESEAKAAEQTDCAAQEQAERRVHAEADRFEADVRAHMELVAKLKAKGEEDGTVVFRVLDDGSRHCQARLVPGRGDDARRALLDCCRKLQLIPAEPDESREWRER